MQRRQGIKEHISVCIATYRRNQMLERLLRHLAVQETGELFDLSVVVVDNDASGPARKTVMRLKSELGLDVTYSIEPERTIPAVRNHALKLARGNYIGIIDDDEFPPYDWLITLLKAIQTFGVDGALGPVYPFFEESPPTWLKKSGFCERPVYRTGTLLRWGQTRTGNVLIKNEVFDKHNLCFDLRFKTGGSDSELFRQAIQKGCRFVAVEEAPVYEIVPPERWKRSYYLKRAMINAYNTHMSNGREVEGLSKVMAPAKSIIAFLCYAISLPFCAFLGTRVLMRCLRSGCYHFGRLLAILGVEVVKKRNF